MEKFYDNRLTTIAENLKIINYEINEAIIKYNREPDDVRLMAVTKTVPAVFVNHALSLGINLIGENKVQEYLSKINDYNKTEVHFIGNLQSNKVKYIIDKVDCIESVGSIKLCKEISDKACSINKTMDILLEVNLGEESSKNGFTKESLHDAIDEILEIKNINLRGLMAIPPIGNTEKYFYQLQQIFIDFSAKKGNNINWDVLSMGMSADFKEAIKYGSNLVRIGSLLFGDRVYK